MALWGKGVCIEGKLSPSSGGGRVSAVLWCGGGRESGEGGRNVVRECQERNCGAS